MPLSKIVANSITDNTITTDQIAGTSVHGRRNILINGGMNVSQRATQVTGLGASNDVFAALDRIKYFVGNTAGRFTAEQVAVTDLPGFANAMKLSCTTADTSIATNEFLGFKHMIEGQDLQRLKKGTSEAESTTLSFYVKGNAAAEYTVELRDIDNDRINTQIFNVTTSWTRVEMTFAADTTGAYDDDTAMSLQMSWWLHAGSTYTGGTFASNTWASRVQGNRVKSSNSSFFDSTSRTLFVTGIQYEVGDKASPFEHRSFAEELTLCERYFQKYECSAQQLIYFEGNTSNHKFTDTTIHRKMRATPTVSLSTNFGHGGGAGGTISSVTTQSIGPDIVSYRVGFTANIGSSYQLRHSDSFDGDVASYSAEL